MTATRTKRVTITEIAQASGVSSMTVSRALNGRGRIAESTRHRIREMASQLGYRSSRAAQALRTNRTNIVGCLLPNRVPALFGTLFDAFADVLHDNGYDAVLSLSANDPARAARSMAGFADFLDAVVYTPLVSDEVNRSNILRIKETGMPLVVLGPFSDMQVDCVFNDEMHALMRVTDHLINLGHRRIGFLAGRGFRVVPLRAEGHRRAFEAHGLPWRDDWQVHEHGLADFDAGQRGIRTLLRRDPTITAVCAANDQVAQGAYRALAELGVRVPDEISVFGFGNSEEMGRSDPPLCTVDQRAAQFGAAAARLLLDRIKGGGPASPREVLIPTDLVIRQSIAPPRDNAALSIAGLEKQE